LISLDDLRKFSKHEVLFNQNLRAWEVTPNLLNQNVREYARESNGISNFSEENYTDSHLLARNKFSIFANEMELEMIDDSYTYSKFLYNKHNYLNLNLLNTNLNFTQPLSHIQVLNSYHSNFAESSTVYNELVKNELDSNLHNNEIYDIRSLNVIRLRSSAKSSIAFFNAIQKVYRP
jgi:hypothetical protein